MNPRAEPPDVGRLLTQQSLLRLSVNHRGASASLMRARRPAGRRGRPRDQASVFRNMSEAVDHVQHLLA